MQGHCAVCKGGNEFSLIPQSRDYLRLSWGSDKSGTWNPPSSSYSRSRSRSRGASRGAAPPMIEAPVEQRKSRRSPPASQEDDVGPHACGPTFREQGQRSRSRSASPVTAPPTVGAPARQGTSQRSLPGSQGGAMGLSPMRLPLGDHQSAVVVPLGRGMPAVASGVRANAARETGLCAHTSQLKAILRFFESGACVVCWVLGRPGCRTHKLGACTVGDHTATKTDKKFKDFKDALAFPSGNFCFACGLPVGVSRPTYLKGGCLTIFF